MHGVGKTVYFFNPNEEEIVSAPVEMVLITEEGVFYKVGDVTLPERQVFSAREVCRMHYLEIFK